MSSASSAFLSEDPRPGGLLREDPPAEDPETKDYSVAGVNQGPLAAF